MWTSSGAYLVERYALCEGFPLLALLEIARAWAASPPKAWIRYWVLGRCLLPMSAKPCRRDCRKDACSSSRSLAWQRSIHDRVIRYSTTSCRNHSAGADAPRSELIVALRGRSMQYAEHRVPRTPLPGTSVNKPPGNTPVPSGWHHRRC
jgi:hypothetical protein